MAITTRKPMGVPPWPIMLLAGREKAGKTWAALSASGSPLVGRTLYIGLGEDDPDEYGLIPGAEFEIVVHDGTFEGFLGAVRDAVAEPAVGGLPTLIVVDSMTRLWNLIQDNMQAIANRRAKGRKTASGDYTISTDLWNVAAGQWQDVMDALRMHQGPVVLTARLDSVAVMENGTPTAQKEWKVQAHKTLVFDASVVVEMRERGSFLITGLRSVRIALEKPKQYPDFTVEKLWGDLGLAEGSGKREHAAVVADKSGPEPGQPTKQDRVNAAVAAVQKASTPEKLDEIEEHAKKLGIDGIEPLKGAVAARRADLGASSGDAWAPAESEPVGASSVTTWSTAEVKP